MASETTKFQVNFKTAKGSLINVYADSVVEGIATMNEMAAAVDLITTIEARLSGAVPVAAAPAAPVFESAPVVQAAPVAAPAAPAAAGHVCKHGAMNARSGNGAKGPWSGWFCPTPKGTPDQCAPIFNR